MTTKTAEDGDAGPAEPLLDQVDRLLQETGPWHTRQEALTRSLVPGGPTARRGPERSEGEQAALQSLVDSFNAPRPTTTDEEAEEA